MLTIHLEDRLNRILNHNSSNTTHLAQLAETATVLEISKVELQIKKLTKSLTLLVDWSNFE